MRNLIIAVSILLLLSGCGPSKEEQSDELYKQAWEHYKSGDFNSAVEVFEKSLELDESPGVRTKLSEVKNEIAFVKELSISLNKLEKLNHKLLNTVQSDDELRITDEIELLLRDFEVLNPPSGTEIIDVVLTIQTNVFDLRGYCVSFASAVLSGVGDHSERKENLYNELESFLSKNKIPDFYKQIT
jgi:DNA uptake lipoprotein